MTSISKDMESPQAQLLQYGEIVLVDLAENAVNFADDLIQGHRVQVPIAVDDLNTFFKWSRPAGQDRPVGVVTGLSDLELCIRTSLSDGFLDLDAVSTGLSYTTGVLVNETNISNSMNDIVLCYILYMVYGKSSFNTSGKVFNIEDAFQMLDNQTVSSAICTSISNHNERGQSIDEMFQDLLKTDPTRFFDAEGHQVPGLFEIHTDESAEGTWLFTPGDCIEIKLQFTFQEPVTRRVLKADQHPLSTQGIQFSEQATEQVIIPKDATFALRLQLLATAERSSARIYQLEHGGSQTFIPTSPKNVVLAQTTIAGELAITYTSGNSHGLPILGNHIRVYDSNGDKIYDLYNTHIITGLETKAYSVTVAQRNSLGEGQVSELSNPCIPITTVANPPTNVVLSQTDKGGELQVSWTAPFYTGGQEITGYLVQVLDSSHTIVQDIVSTGSPFVILNVVATEIYQVQLATQNATGDSIWSPPSNTVSPLGTLTSAPTSVSLLPSSTAGELLASWSTPVTTGGLSLLYYTVCLFVDQDSTPILTQSTPNTYLVFSENLVNTHTYSIYVTATNSAGESVPSATTPPTALT